MIDETVTIWDRSHETLERAELAQVQLERLQASIFRAYRNVAFYRKRFDALGIAPEDVASLAQLRALPFTTREDLRDGYPYDLLAVPLREVVRLHGATGGASRPTVCAFTRNDVRHWTELMARLLSAAGISRDDVVQVLFNTGNLGWGMGFQHGAERLGASVIPATTGGMDQHLTIMQDFKSTALVGTAGDAIHLATLVAEGGLDTRRLSLRAGLFGAEPWSEAMRQFVETGLGIIALDTYGLGELGGPGVAGECAAKCGLHLAEDHFLAEIVDPETGAPVPDGQEGELVLTTLTREALPLLRFRTRDITRLETAPCACGRTLARIARLSQRTDGSLIIGGRKLHPRHLEEILADLEGAQPNYQIVIARKHGEEMVEIAVEILPGLSTDTPGKLLAVEGEITARIARRTGLAAHVRLVESATIARLSEGGTRRVIDRRE
jgi:phenylacetate-CoA ligase